MNGRKNFHTNLKNQPNEPVGERVVSERGRKELLPVVNECYQKWWELQCQVNEFYSGKKQERPPLSKQKEFRTIRNAVIRVI